MGGAKFANFAELAMLFANLRYFPGIAKPIPACEDCKYDARRTLARGGRALPRALIDRPAADGDDGATDPREKTMSETTTAPTFKPKKSVALSGVTAGNTA